jgi:phospho-N-acetylmuramoyl-pentapeptide-transferase
MLFYLSYLQDAFGAFRLFNFITFRAAGALFTSMLVVLFLGNYTVRTLHRLQVYSPGRLEGIIADDLLDHKKDKTPIMGGILVIFAIIISLILWGKLENPLLLLFIITLLAFGGLGFIDDYLKVTKHRFGISAKMKIVIQLLITLSALAILFKLPATGAFMYQVMVPLYKYPILTGIYGAIGSVILGTFTMVGASNAVNLTDGKDGLVAGCTISTVSVLPYSHTCAAIKYLLNI